MPHYRAYTTTVVGAHSVPRWYEALDRLVTAGQLSTADFTDAQFRATQAAMAPEQTIITSSCGFNHLPRHIALGKLRAMTEAKAILADSAR